jgi:copper transport protein
VGRLLRVIALAALTFVFVGVFAIAASAHAEVVRSQPADGANVGSAPDRAVLWFDQEIAPSFGSARLVDDHGRPITGTRVLVSDDPRVLELELPDLTPGSYAILWQVLAESDGHTTDGVTVFSVGAPGASAMVPVVDGSAGTSPLDVALRWLGYCVLAGLVGGLAVAILVLGRARASGRAVDMAEAIDRARFRVLTMAGACAALGTVVAVATPLREATKLAHSSPGRSAGEALTQIFWSTRWGHLWLAREAVLIALMVVVLIMRSRVEIRAGRRRSGWQLGAGVLVLILAGIEALGSHAAALDAGRGAAVVADSVHILAALLWMGALPALILILWRDGVDDGRAAMIRATRGPFTRLAIVSVGAIVLTGLYSAGREVETVQDLVSTTYGRMLLAKTVLFFVIGGLGLLNSLRFHGRRATRDGDGPRRRVSGSPSRTLIVVESGVGALLLVAAGVLTSSPPARGPVRMMPPPATTTFGRSVDDLLVSVSVTSNRPGVNGFTVLATSSRRPPPAPIDDVGLQLGGSATATPVALHEVELGRYFGTATIDSSGRTKLTVTIQRAGEEIEFPLSWSVAHPAVARFVPRSGRRLAPIVDALAWLLLFAALAAVAARSWVRRRRPDITVPTEELVIERVTENVP